MSVQGQTFKSRRTVEKWKPKMGNNYNYHGTNASLEYLHKTHTNRSIMKKKELTKTESSKKRSRITYIGKPRFLSMNSEPNNRIKRKLSKKSDELKCTGRTVSENSTLLAKVKLESTENNRRNDSPNKRDCNCKRDVIFDPYNNPLLDYLYEACLEIDRLENETNSKDQ